MLLVITMSFPNGKKKALTLSYDDGVRTDRRLVRILDEHGIKATFNINSGVLGDAADRDSKGGRMSQEEIEEFFHDSHHEVAIHGLEHSLESNLPDNLMAYEIIKDRANIEQMTGRIVRGMAYPFGGFNDKLVTCLEMCGIAYSRTTISSHNFNMPKDWRQLAATCHHADPKLMELCDEFLDMDSIHPQLFYLWGHSYEFDYNCPSNNWDIITEFAEKMGHREDIWYATNIEIHDYTKAFESLQFSTDHARVYNPTAIDVWFRIGDYEGPDTYCVKAGQLLELKA